mmetsp:Transcript_64147/g.171748  ORF Transcript_64147/g.171748 Transcript_64147/m.171748 type:complete len:161 (+) Transcript_64147:388-870(+)
MDLKFSDDAPSQYWKASMYERASCALLPGRYLRTLGSIRSSFSMEASNEMPCSLCFALMNCPITDSDLPKRVMVKDPTLFSRITSGMDGNTRTTSSWFFGCVMISITFSASFVVQQNITVVATPNINEISSEGANRHYILDEYQRSDEDFGVLDIASEML